jgi:Zn-dependent M32 family carboxypeptidase
LVRWPGYMINYGLGAVVTAEIRQHTAESIGEFATGNPRWYPWISSHLLRFGSAIDTPQLLHQFLGRAVSTDSLLRQLRRVGLSDAFAGQHLGQTALE